ncbi:hypothetical protein ACIGJO_27500 [Streptomyces sp. NPDC079020]|uniref:hypothetical protein n=1 Tax=Streptomyces sp. NPDC079020 TaxID=3365722 RepID=UPI0037D7FC4A
MSLRTGRRRAAAPSGRTPAGPAQETGAVPGPLAAAPVRTDWLIPAPDGRLSAFAPARTGGVVRWTERPAGRGGWNGPELLLADARILPYLCAAHGPAGFVDLFGLRRTGDSPRGPVEIVYASQYQAGRPMTGWHSIGNPHGKDAAKAPAIGAPVAVVDGADALHVFVRNADGGVSTRRRAADGVWGKWTAMPCKRVREGLSAVVTRSGRVELFMPADKGVYVWRQETPGGPLDRAPNLVFIALPRTASGTESYEGRITHYWRDETSGEVVAHRLPAADAPDTVPVSLDGRSGHGPLALTRCLVDGYDCTVLAQAEQSGTLALTAYPTELESAGAWWADTREPCEGAPAVALDREGRLVVAAIGPDGRLKVTRQRADQQGMALEGWLRL